MPELPREEDKKKPEVTRDPIHDAETGTYKATHNPDPWESDGERAAPSLLANMLAIVGLIILIVVIIWGLVHLASLSGTWFSSLFGAHGTTPAITLEAPQSIASGSGADISWKYTPSTEGSYAFVYQCVPNLYFKTDAGNKIPCGTALLLPATTSALTVVPILTGAQAVDAPLSVSYVNKGASSPATTASATTQVKPAATVSAPASTQSSAGTQSSSATTAPSGPADLSVRIVSVSADQYGNGTAIFDIANVGGSASGSYYFTAQLPTRAYGAGYTYTSPLQSSLAPGAHITSTLHFTQAIAGTFSVNVDPQGRVQEATKTNNYASRVLSYAQSTYTNYNTTQYAPVVTGYTAPPPQAYYGNYYNYQQPQQQPYYQYQYNQPQPYYTY